MWEPLHIMVNFLPILCICVAYIWYIVFLWLYSCFLNSLLSQEPLRTCRSSHGRYSVKNDVLKISQTSFKTCVGVFFNKVGGPKAYSFTKKLQHRCFPVKYLTTPIFKNICKGLSLKYKLWTHNAYFLLVESKNNSTELSTHD